MADLASGLAELRTEIDQAIARVVNSGGFILGEEVTGFETEFARYVDTKHAVGLNSGTDALIIGLTALSLSADDEVITSPFTFVASASSILHAGAIPVFADIDPVTYALDPASVEQLVTERTKAIVVVHLFGRPADLSSLQALATKHGIALVEDTAQALGSRHEGKMLGSLGLFGTHSFFPSKNLGAFGDGGMLVTNDDALAHRVRVLRGHGASRKYFNEFLGYNSRLDAIQAAVLRVKLPHLDRAIATRRAVAQRYEHALHGAPNISTPCGGTVHSCQSHSFHQYTIRLSTPRKRDLVRGRLAAEGIATAIYYPTPLHETPLFGQYATVALPEAERAARHVLSLPIWPAMSHKQQDRVTAALLTAVEAS